MIADINTLDEIRHLIEDERKVVQKRVDAYSAKNMCTEYEVGMLAGMNRAIQIVNERSIQETNELLEFFA